MTVAAEPLPDPRLPRSVLRRRRRGLVLLAAVASIPLLEAGLRIASPHEDYIRYDRSTRWSLRPGWEGSGPTLAHASRPYRVRVNRLGFRGEEFSTEKEDGTFRLVALGDSVTFGFGVDDEDAFPAVLARDLASKAGGRRVEGINAGVPGFTSLQGMRHLRSRVLPLRPDLLTVLFGWNDGWRTTVEDAAWIGRLGGLRGLLEPCRVFGLFRRGTGFVSRRLAKPAAPPTRPLLVRVPVDDFEDHVRAIATAARGSGARVLLLTAPAAFGPGRPPDSFFRETWSVPPEELGPTRERYGDAVRRVATSEGALLVDLARLLPPDPTLFVEDGYHPNPQGHRRIAELLLEAVRASGALEDWAGR